MESTPLMQLTSVLRSDMKWEYVGVGRILRKLDKANHDCLIL
jgi:hypothetical protein